MAIYINTLGRKASASACVLRLLLLFLIFDLETCCYL